MRGLMFVLTAFAVMGLAFWAYQENYRTQAALKESAALKREIGSLRETLSIGPDVRCVWFDASTCSVD